MEHFVPLHMYGVNANQVVSRMTIARGDVNLDVFKHEESAKQVLRQAKGNTFGSLGL
jgi:hypothetical protein